MAAPSHKMVAETFQTGLRPSKSGQRGREAVSKREPALPKALPAPQLTGLHTLGASPGTPSYAHGTLGSARHKCCWAGSLLPGGHPPPRRSAGTLPPQEPPCHGRGPKPHGALARPGNNPAPKACAARRLQSSTEHSTPAHLKHLVFAPSN